MHSRPFSTVVRRLSHENPLGLPRKGTPPSLTRRGGPPPRRRLPNIAHTLAITSAKGGVGKSTIAANLALALARRGLRVGLLDADLHGPSIPLLFDLADAGAPRLTDAGQLVPLTRYGVQTMSIGYLVASDAPVAWRGLLAQRALQQLLHDVAWGTCDVLLLDLPPGTGDVPLTVAQQVALDAALLVATPSRLALADTRRGAALLRRLEVPLLGVVQNMATFVCPGCGAATPVFGHAAPGEPRARLREECQADGLEVLADVPLDAGICEMGDAGKPSVVGAPESLGAKVFGELAATVAAKMGM